MKKKIFHDASLTKFNLFPYDNNIEFYVDFFDYEKQVYKTVKIFVDKLINFECSDIRSMFWLFNNAGGIDDFYLEDFPDYSVLEIDGLNEPNENIPFLWSIKISAKKDDIKYIEVI